MSAIALSIEFTIGGRTEPTVTRLTAAFERAGAEVADVGKHVLPKLVPVLEEAVARQFDAQGAGPEMGSWAPLSESYAAWKEKHYPGAPILVRTGKLRAALTDSNAEGARRDVGSDVLTYGTQGVPYASHHQEGTSRMPARPPFDFGAGFEAGMQAAAAAGVREAVREASDGLLDFDGDTFEGLPVQSGARGGRFIESGGARTYLKKTSSGEVVKRRFGGGR